MIASNVEGENFWFQLSDGRGSLVVQIMVALNLDPPLFIVRAYSTDPVLYQACQNCRDRNV